MSNPNASERFSRLLQHDKVVHAIMILIIAFIVIFIIGVVGYGYFFQMSATDAIFNTSLTVSNLGIGLHEKTPAEKMFTGIYSVVAGIFFISLVSAIVAYIFTLYLEM